MADETHTNRLRVAADFRPRDADGNLRPPVMDDFPVLIGAELEWTRLPNYGDPPSLPLRWWQRLFNAGRTLFARIAQGWS